MQYAVKRKDYSIYKRYTKLVNNHHEQPFMLRHLLGFNKKNKPIAIDEVEPATNIYKRLATGAMSFGSISMEAHATIAIAMNRLGGKSNTGEGGEDPIRYKLLPNGDNPNSAIKQIASGRFGVTIEYLSNASELQIKIAQGAKPGEGGQLPGDKVDQWIAAVRHATPGVGLISPPPHHDIYSIEDLSQLIYDLKHANPKARISVKLVSKAGVGTIATGVAKAMADVILISGWDGGTGAAPISSIRHAGLPWELGLAETQQTLVRNKTRDKVILQTDGQLRTGLDLAIATLLGAEEWGIATTALIVEGCIMMRKCHLNTCPVGIATQDEQLRKKFTGTPEQLITFIEFLVQDLREIMAELGFKTINEMVGHADYLSVYPFITNPQYKKIDLAPLLYYQANTPPNMLFHSSNHHHDISKDILDVVLIEKAKKAIINKIPIKEAFNIRNINRAVGTMLSHELFTSFGKDAIPNDFVTYTFMGSAGQSFGAFLTKGISFRLEGDANDSVGKGMCGGKLIIYPPKNTIVENQAQDNIIIGNAAFYGATSGHAFVRGLAGERCCVRNSGVELVIEGMGDHGCEYMTGGRVIILGGIGRNFAAGMSGGIAYIYKQNDTMNHQINFEMVNLDVMNQTDTHYIHRQITEHYKLTLSNVAKYVLENWELSLKHFVKILPKDYLKALLKATGNKKGASV